MDSIILYVIGVIMICFVLFQSLYFLKKAYDRGLEIGLSEHQLKEIIRSSAFFSVVPSIPILIGLITLIPIFGSVVIPWIRLSVLGSVSYESYAANAIRNAAGVDSLFGDPIAFSTAVWTMTISIMAGLVTLILFYRKYEKKLTEVRKKDSRWGELLIAALFMGLVGTIGAQQIAIGGYNTLALFISMAIMLAIGLASKKWKWLEEFALPVSILSTLGIMYVLIM
ncbi:MAG: hypothetical protein CVU96_04940 [Firmicutes bacterium HGW-Firmicutes-20]|jgi:hypothetical protein|nr:MAG: hypothetical protein CVU96_04940 [Firmicutes bacterium HGW-Firmicutes-20]PKM70092.1 MAG: hypothetical protein CVU94_00930 [Firmicutes bacterium HGW-Firmicutes-19]